MKKKTYPNTAIKASRLGFGAWPLGNTAHGKTMSIEDGVALVEKALKEGVTFFDTAPNYAKGRSETILGKALEGKRHRVIINTKFGHDVNDVIDFSEERIVPSIEASMERLKTDYLDSVILHNPDQSVLKGETGHFDILSRLKEDGRIKAYGVSIDTPEELRMVLDRDDIDVIELLFNIYAQSSRKLFDEVKDRGIALIIKVPLDSGWLTGKYTKDSTFTDIRSRWTPEIKERRDVLTHKLKSLLGTEKLAPEAMRFIWSFDAVTTVIPGIRTESQLHEHLEAEKTPMDTQNVRKLIEFNDEKIKDDPLPW